MAHNFKNFWSGMPPALKRKRSAATFTKRARMSAPLGVRALPAFASASTAIIRGPERREIKAYSTTPWVSQTFNTTGLMGQIAAQIPTGDDYNQREGRIIKLMDCSWSITSLMLAGLGAAYNMHYRVIVFVWTPGLTNPSTGDVLDSANLNGQYSVQHNGLVKILFDKTYELVQKGVGTQDTRRVDYGKVRLGMQQEYPATTITAQANKNTVHMLVVSTDSVNTFTVKCQTRFVDV